MQELPYSMVSLIFVIPTTGCDFQEVPERGSSSRRGHTRLVAGGASLSE